MRILSTGKNRKGLLISMADKMCGGGDSCTVKYPDDEAREKLNKWLKELKPEDYDAPGSTVREQGV